MQLHSTDLKSYDSRPLSGIGLPKFPHRGIDEISLAIRRKFLDLNSPAFQVNILVGRRVKTIIRDATQAKLYEIIK